MSYKSCLLLVTLVAGCLALPVQDEDLSIYFDHTDANSRIVGGSLAGPVPYMAAMIQGQQISSLICGASIVSSTHLLTAAHCIGSSTTLRVRVGSNSWGSGGQEYIISRRIVHPGYVSSIIKNDIGMLITSLPMDLGLPLVKAIKISEDFIPGGVPVTVNGWGRTMAGGPISAQLLGLNKTTVDGEQCHKDVQRRAAELNMRGVPPVDAKVEICTFRGLNQGACNGDSGSALVKLVADDNTGVRRMVERQVGIVSWGLPCARGAPDMFVRVSAFKTWIKENMAQ